MLRPSWARSCLRQSTFARGDSFTVAQLPRLAPSCVESQRVQAYVNSSSVRVGSVDHSHLQGFHPEHVANAFTYDNKHTSQYVLHEKILKSFNLHTGCICVRGLEQHKEMHFASPDARFRTRSTKLAWSMMDEGCLVDTVCLCPLVLFHCFVGEQVCLKFLMQPCKRQAAEAPT